MKSVVARLGRFETDALADEWLLWSIRGSDGLGQAPVYDLVASPRHRIQWLGLSEALVGARAHLVIDPEGESPHEITGVIDRVDLVGSAFQIRLIHRFATLGDHVDHRVFVEEKALDIVTAVLEEHGFRVAARCTRSHPVRGQCVQHFESDLDFVTRLLAEEGALWFCAADSADEIVVVDNPSGFSELDVDPYSILESSGLSRAADEQALFDVRLGRRVVSEKVTLRDYNFLTPALDMTAEASAEDGQLEQYEYRRPYQTPAEGQALAELRLEAYRRDRTVLTGSGLDTRLRVGHVIRLQGGASGQAGAWLVTNLALETAESSDEFEAFRVEIRAVPAAAGYRGKLPERARFGGVQTLTVAGASGDEIFTEEHGRVKAHLRWDRVRPMDDQASYWLRVVQPPTSGGFFLPRVGWEVLAGFWDASADDPFVIGRLYNGEAVPPDGLPGNKVVTAYGTSTTPGGGSANLVGFNDTAGNEGMTFNASYDFNERTEKDKVTSITADETSTVGVNRDLIVGNKHEVAVAGSQTYSVGATRNVGVEANKFIKSGSEAIAVGGARIFDIGGDQQTQCTGLLRSVGGAKVSLGIEHDSALVTGAASRLYAGSWAQVAGMGVGVTVGGASVVTVAGPQSTKAASYALTAKSLGETYASRSEQGRGIIHNAGGRMKYHVSGALMMKGSDVVFKAKDKITIKADGVTIEMTSSKITIKGKFDSSQAAADSADYKYD